MISASTLVTLLTLAAGYAVRHFQLLSKLGSLVGIAAGPNPLGPSPAPSDNPSPVASPNPVAHPILSDAVNAAITKAVADVTAGHIASLKDELIAVAKAAAAAAVADLQKKA